MSLRERLIERIRAEGPISIADYMTACLHDPEGGYYARRPAIGDAGDFITAPVVSQMFGELIGLWAVEAWRRLGEPARVTLAELGPGTGAMMADILRAARLEPAFLAAADVWFVETSAPLRRLQAAAVTGARGAESIDALPPDAPVILLANEFLDCLPIVQWERTDGGWAERRVGVDGGELAFIADVGAPIPFSPVGMSDQKWTAAVPGRVGVGVGAHGPERLPLHPSFGSIWENSKPLQDFGRSIGVLIARAGGA
ncbi:MAG: SAM-dependent methyltransferase, partial [Caulobacteraceae bacterium]